MSKLKDLQKKELEINLLIAGYMHYTIDARSKDQRFRRLYDVDNAVQADKDGFSLQFWYKSTPSILFDVLDKLRSEGYIAPMEIGRSYKCIIHRSPMTFEVNSPTSLAEAMFYCIGKVLIHIKKQVP